MADSQDSLPLPVMAAGLIHEVRNPLSAIHLHLQLLENQILQVEDEELRLQMSKRVNIIKLEILALNQTLQDFIRLIRSETRSIAHTGVNEIVEQVVDLLSPQARAAQIEVQVHLTDEAQNLQIDTSFLKQSLINLILNSIQSFDSLSDEFKNRDRQIIISTGTENGVFYLRVEDNGAGIQPKDQEKIFDPFFTTKTSGSGLGLSLVRKMMLEMNGRVEVDSSPGQGTRFTLFFGQALASLPNPNTKADQGEPVL